MSETGTTHEPPKVSAEHDRRIDYIEFPATDIQATKRFYEQAFGWKFTDYGPAYTSFEDGRLTGGFRAEATVARGGALVILFAVDLDDAERRVRDAGGTIVKPTFSFPGGRRFHFTDPSGNELAVWSDK
jgi:predicted enzyme related to lactoylglutathione lyase